MPFILHEILVSATPLTGHLHSKDGHGVLLLTSGSLIRRVLYYNVYIYIFFTCYQPKISLLLTILYKTYNIFLCTKRIEIHYFF